jgi:hypothetical protein
MKQKRKFTGKEKALLTALIIAMAAVVGLGAFIIVNNVNSANEQAANTENTTVSYTHPETTKADTTPENTEKDDSKSKTKSKSASGVKNSNTSTASNGSVSKSTSLSKYTPKKSVSKSKVLKSSSSSKKSSRSSKASKTIKPSGDKIPVYTPSENTSHVSEEICTVNGKKCHVGDTITMTLNLKTPVVLVNYQGYTTFDNGILEFKKADSESGALINCKGGKIFYNSSVLSGLDFTSTGTVYYAKFKVKKAGDVTIENVFEVMSALKDDSQVPLSQCTIGIEIFD